MIRFERITYWCGLALAVALLLCTCEGWRKDNRRNAANLKASRDSTQHFKNRLGVATASRQALLLDYEQMENLYLDASAENKAMAKEFAKVQSLVKVKAKISLPSVKASFKDSIPCSFDRSGRVAQKWFGLKYNVNPHGLQLDSITIPATARVMTGIKRKWIFGKETVVTDVTFDNPYIHAAEVESAQVVVKTPWYKKWYVWCAAGLAGGLLLK